MLPLLIDPSRLRILVVGDGAAVDRRRRLLEEAGAGEIVIHPPGSPPDAAEIAAAHLLFVAGLPDEEAAPLVAIARAARVLVHVEDSPALSDLHAPSVLRRGDLTIAVSTNGKSPGLARRVRHHLEGLFGAEWRFRLDEIGELRRRWREAGAGMPEIARWTEDWVDRHGWLGEHPPAARLAANDAAC